jgi:hypothetical protein
VLPHRVPEIFGEWTSADIPVAQERHLFNGLRKVSRLNTAHFMFRLESLQQSALSMLPIPSNSFVYYPRKTVGKGTTGLLDAR